MKKILKFSLAFIAVLVMSSIDSISDLVFSNPFTAYFATVIMFVFLAFIVAVFAYLVKQFLNKLEEMD